MALGDLLVGPTLDVPEDDGHPDLRRKAIEAFPDEFLVLFPDEAPFGAGEGVLGDDLIIEFVPLCLLPLGPTILVDEVVFGEGQEPGREIPGEVVLPEGAVELEEDLLGHVLSFLGAPGELVGHVEDLSGVRVNEHFPSLSVALQALLNDLVQFHSIHLD